MVAPSILLLWISLMHPRQDPAIQGGAATASRVDAMGPLPTTQKRRLQTQLARLKLDPDSPTAARDWTSVALEVFRTTSQFASDVSFDDVRDALPSPKTWPEIRRIARLSPNDVPSQNLVLLADALLNDPSALRAGVDRILASPSGSALSHKDRRTELLKLKLTLALDRHDREGILSSAREILALHGSIDFNERLIAEVGEHSAKHLMKFTLTQTGSPLSYDGRRAKILADQVLRENVDMLESPNWALVGDPGCIDLYPRVQKRFPNTEGFDSEQMHALLSYAFQLFVGGKAELAVNLIKKPSSGIRPEASIFEMGGTPEQALKKPQAWLTFLDRCAQQAPRSMNWSSYASSMRLGGRVDHALAVMEKVLTTSALQNWAEFDSAYVLTLLSQGLVDRAAARPRHIHEPGFLGSYPSQTGPLAWINIGRLLKRSDIVNSGIVRLAERNDGTLGLAPSDPIKPLVSAGRADIAEQIVVAFESNLAWHEEPSKRQDVLKALCYLYRLANRPNDVLAVVEGATSWHAHDLAEIYFDGPPAYAPFSVMDMGATYAWALSEVGRSGEAARMVMPALHLNPSSDLGYPVLLRAKGAAALPILDQLAAEHPDEARPLIWKAEELRRLKLLGEAEHFARSAIAMDPNDRTEPAEDRARAYRVLAEVLTDQGKDPSVPMRRVNGVRIAAEAEELATCGLTKLAIERYGEAISVDPGDAASQFALANALTSLGDTRAREHYLAGFRLVAMGAAGHNPESFYDALMDPKATILGVEVMRKALAASPSNGDAHLCLGVLLDDTDPSSGTTKAGAVEYSAALKSRAGNYEAAARALRSSAYLSKEESVAALKVYINLDPWSHKSYVGPLETKIDPKILWETTKEAQRPQAYRMPEALFPLNTSTDSITPMSAPLRGNFSMSTVDDRGRIGPGTWATDGPTIRSMSQLFHQP